MRKTIILLSILLLLAAAVGCGSKEPEVLRLATTTSTPSRNRDPSRSMARAFSAGGIDGEDARSNSSSTLESAVLTLWPPGPLEWEKRHVSSAEEMLKVPRMRIAPGT